jgi:hypothetical protein
MRSLADRAPEIAVELQQAAAQFDLEADDLERQPNRPEN